MNYKYQICKSRIHHICIIPTWPKAFNINFSNYIQTVITCICGEQFKIAHISQYSDPARIELDWTLFRADDFKIIEEWLHFTDYKSTILETRGMSDPRGRDYSTEMPIIFTEIGNFTDIL